jgi:hypothetical protein
MYIRRIEPLSCAKVVGALHGLAGFVMALFFAAGAQMLQVFTRSLLWLPDEDMSLALMPDFFSWGLSSLIWLPVLYGLLGFVIGWIAAWSYNLVAGRTGGIRIEVDMEMESD